MVVIPRAPTEAGPGYSTGLSPIFAMRHLRY
jgi:hypothetical protein